MVQSFVEKVVNHIRFKKERRKLTLSKLLLGTSNAMALLALLSKVWCLPRQLCCCWATRCSCLVVLQGSGCASGFTGVSIRRQAEMLSDSKHLHTKQISCTPQQTSSFKEELIHSNEETSGTYCLTLQLQLKAMIQLPVIVLRLGGRPERSQCDQQFRPQDKRNAYIHVFYQFLL